MTYKIGYKTALTRQSIRVVLLCMATYRIVARSLGSDNSKRTSSRLLDKVVEKIYPYNIGHRITKRQKETGFMPFFCAKILEREIKAGGL